MNIFIQKLTRLLIIINLGNLLACGVVSKTKNETKAVQAVADFYGGYCEPFIGISASTETGNKKFFELKVTESDVLEQYKNSPEIASSNVAYIFYTNLQEEKSNYSEIRSQLVFKNQEIFNSSYSASELELIQDKLRMLDELTSRLKEQNYLAISQMLSEESFSKEEKAGLIENIRLVEPKFGALKGYTILGFKKDSYNDFQILDVFVIMDRAKEKIQLNVKLDFKAGENKIHYLDYKFEI